MTGPVIRQTGLTREQRGERIVGFGGNDRDMVLAGFHAVEDTDRLQNGQISERKR